MNKKTLLVVNKQNFLFKLIMRNARGNGCSQTNKKGNVSLRVFSTSFAKL